VATRARVTASPGARGRGPLPPVIYRAEAYDDDDQFREPVWTCTHHHPTVEAALRCGEVWLQEQGRPSGTV
jgi:hypothetical protein